MNIRETVKNYIRILQISKKARKVEFLETIRICGIGIAVVGMIGFLFYLVNTS